MKKLMVLMLVGGLGGCVTTQSATVSLEPVCAALGDPIQYNSRNPKSAYHAGAKLAPRLAVQNRVGVNLHCPAYRDPPPVTISPATPAKKPRAASFIQRFTGKP